jgi:hypothetical protein
MAARCLILQKRDNAKAVVIQDETKVNYMKTSYLKTNWFIPLLGIAVVAVSLLATQSYLDLERQTHNEEILMTTLDRIYLDHQLSWALRTIHAGEADAAVAAGGAGGNGGGAWGHAPLVFNSV